MSTPVMPIVVTDKEGESLIGEWLYCQQQIDWAKYKWTKKRQEKERTKWTAKKDEVMSKLAPWLELNYAEFADRIVNVGEFGSSRKMYRCIYVKRT